MTGIRIHDTKVVNPMSYPLHHRATYRDKKCTNYYRNTNSNPNTNVIFIGVINKPTPVMPASAKANLYLSLVTDLLRLQLTLIQNVIVRLIG